MTLQTTLNFVAQPSSNFSCTLCGRCCRHDWGIMLTPEDEARFTDLTAPWADPTYQQPLTTQALNGQGRPLIVINRRADTGACPMLGAGNSCRMWQTGGEDAMPNICQIYPYYFIETPDGVIVSTRFDCEAVVDNVGTPLVDQTAQIARAYERAKTLNDAGIVMPLDVAKIQPLKSIVGLTWPAYKVLEARVMDVLTRDGAIAKKLIKVATIIESLTAFGLRQGVRELDETHLVQWEREPLPQFLTPQLTQHYATAGDFAPVAVRGGNLDAQAAVKMLQIKRGTFPLIFDGQPPVNVAAHAAVKFDKAASAYLSQHLARYCTDQVFTKNLWQAPSIEIGVVFLFAYTGLVEWLARAAALEQRRTLVTRDDVREAAIRTEREITRLVRFAVAHATT